MLDKLLSAQTWLSIATTGLRLVLIVTAAWVAGRLGGVFIDRLFVTGPDKRHRYLDERRANTMRALLKNALRYLIDFVAVLPVLELFGIKTSSILAGAGVAGLAIGFGAQNLVRDVITGFFIIYEDQYAVGEYITTAGVSGIVEEIGLRVTRLRHYSGEVHVIPNGSIDKTTNHSRGSSLAWVEVSVAYEEDIDKVMQVLGETCRQAAADLSDIEEGPMPLGITKLADSGVIIAVYARTKPLTQWAVERELRKRIKAAFDREGIEIPYPRSVVVPSKWTKIGSSYYGRER